MILYPSKDEIIDAVTKGPNIIPIALRGFKCVMGKFGPLYYPGGFCLVFKLIKGKECKALRVWYASVDDIQNRMKGLSDFLSERNLPFFVPFTFYEKGLRVSTTDGVSMLDIMVMDWVEGLDLKSFLKQSIRRNSLNEISVVADKLIEVFRLMHEHGISHGDLQHTNILIQNDLSIMLIDYDSVYYPGTLYSSHTTRGYLEYQHPARCYSNAANEKTDYFSELIIYLALLSYIYDPSMWDRYSIESLDNSILFQSKDYDDLDHSKLFNEISRRNNSLCSLCGILKQYLSFNSIDKLTPFVQGFKFDASTQVGKYCTNCGTMFMSPSDAYCILCGFKRL